MRVKGKPKYSNRRLILVLVGAAIWIAGFFPMILLARSGAVNLWVAAAEYLLVGLGIYTLIYFVTRKKT